MSVDSDYILRRNNVRVSGSGDDILMFAHGFGCDQNMWRFLTRRLQNDFRIVLFDYVGCGQSDLSAFDSTRYAKLDGYASDITEILSALDLNKVTLIGHSVSAMIAMLAAIRMPQRVSKLVMVCPSPYYFNAPPDYDGGFCREDLEELIDMMDKNYIGWANTLAPLVMGAEADASFVDELANSFCSTDPLTAKTFARATFFSDLRDMLPQCPVPTLVLQSGTDSLAPLRVGDYVARRLPNGQLRVLDTRGHCIHMTDPQLTEAALREFLGR